MYKIIVWAESMSASASSLERPYEKNNFLRNKNNRRTHQPPQEGIVW
jgi:hypothetical protein